MSDLAFSSIKSIAQKIKTKEITIPEVYNYFVTRSKQLNPQLGAALEIFDDINVDKVLHGQEGPLVGIPGFIKDNICQKNRITACGSKMLEHYEAPYDATASYRLKQAGAISIGRANLDEFAMGSSTETSAFFLCKNPWNLDRVPGGSSGGSIAAVAAGLAPWALGSETGGSVRQPAALCGVVGLKPTYGRISRYGLVAYGSSLDQIGIATRTVYDNALVLQAIAGHDKQDSTSADVAVPSYTQNLTGKLPSHFKIGVIDNAVEANGIDPEIYTALQDVITSYKKLGAHVTRISLPLMDMGAAVYFILSRAEAASNLARFDGVRYGYRSPQADNLLALYNKSRSEGFGLEVKSRILVGNYVLSAGHADEFYVSACTVRSHIRQQFLQAFNDVDALLSPVSPITAFKFNAFDKNKLQMDLQDYFTAPANLAGMPAISVPCGFSAEQLPIGFQLIGPDFSEDVLFQAAYAYEQMHQWYTQTPKLG